MTNHTTTDTTTNTDGNTARLEVEHLSKTYGSGESAKHIIGDLTFTIGEAEVACIVGRSGIGKTTLLRCLCGLLEPTSGELRIDGEAITGPPRQLSVVFQEYTRSLMPWLSVRDNVELPLRGRLGDTERAERCTTAIEEVGLSHATNQYPWQLSGGMQQRVSIARALAYRPEVLLMDEPFASVDAQTRFELEDLTLKLRDDLGITIVLVTHDIDEAVYLSDRVVVLGGAPAVVNQIIDIDLPTPRDQVHTRALPRFAELRTEVLELIQHDKH